MMKFIAKILDKYLDRLTFDGKKIIDGDTLVSHTVIILLLAFMIYFNDSSVDEGLPYRPMSN